MKEVVDSLLRAAFEKAQLGGELKSPGLPPFVIEVPNDPAHGELASNLALALARGERRAPRDVAEVLRRHVPTTGDVAETSIAGPGFLNFRLSRDFWRKRLAASRAAGASYGLAPAKKEERVQVEFVSANPTGPLTVGHGRNAVLGDTLARLLAARGHDVTREYYFNNAGRQMRVLGESVRARYLERLGRPFTFPEDGYQGDYIREIAAGLEAEHGAALTDA
ncbi:MAG: arginine--tRNA ligase, partial [Candidatus Binatia bacterium]